MPKTREEKEQIVSELTDKIDQAKSIVFADFHGLNVDQSEEIRHECYDQNVEFRACKKTLLKIALDESNLEDVDPSEFEGGVAAVFSNEDQIAPAKITAEFGNDYDPIKIHGGILDKEFITGQKVKDLAELPSKDQLRAKLVGALNSPVSGFVSVLNDNARSLVQVLSSVKDQKQD
jgi:large subunit ribosomal protein L10